MRHLFFISLLFLSIPSFAQLTTGEKYNLGPIGQPFMTLGVKGRMAYYTHPTYTAGDDGAIMDKHYIDSAIGSAVGTPSFSFVKGGNSFAASTFIGLGDDFSLAIGTNNTEWAKIDSLGRFTIGPASQRMNAWQGLARVLGNTGFGYQTLNATHTSAVNNTAIGSQALSADTSGSQNSALGNGALKLVTSGSDNTGFGYRSGGAVTTGIQNTFGGSASATAVTTGSYNTAWGYSALAGNVSANYNTAIGAFSNASGTGASNTSIGAYSLQVNGAGYNNVAMGNFTMNHNSAGFLNTAVGPQALYLNTTGINNVAVGAYALDSVNTGYGNVGVGPYAGYREQGNGFLHIADSLGANRELIYGSFLNRWVVITPPGGTGKPTNYTTDQFQVGGSSYFLDTVSIVNTPAGTGTDSVLVKHGNAVHAVLQSSIASGGVTLNSGIYVPTLVGVNSVTTVTADSAVWLRVGTVVTVSGSMTITPAANNTSTQVSITLPVASLLNGQHACWGSGSTVAGNGTGVLVSTYSTNHIAELTYAAGSSASGIPGVFYYTFQYQIQ